MDVDGEPRAWRCWEELARGEGQQAIAIMAVITATTWAAARTESLLVNVRQKETRED
jgi:hypothetical protein